MGREIDETPLSDVERDRVVSEVRRTIGSRSSLRELFSELEQRFGRSAASALWWAAFGAQDAAET